MNQASLRLSLIIPAYNEERRILPTLDEYVAHLRTLYAPGTAEVIVVLNGCRDGTRGVVEQVMANAPEVRLIEFAAPLGKGGAILEGLAAARGDYVAFVDADNMVRAPETAKLLRVLETHDVAIAGRFGPDAAPSSQPLTRRLLGAASRVWVRRFLGLPYRDTQCGAKAFRATAWHAIAPHVVERGWAFDLDVLAHAYRLGLRVAEVPVRWQHIVEGSKVRLRDLPQTYLATFRIRRRVRALRA